MFMCPSCGYELTAAEAIRLCDYYEDQIARLAAAVGRKRGFLWRFLRLFGDAKKG
jgi:predicted DNA-binding protein (UPF0251 family)